MTLRPLIEWRYRHTELLSLSNGRVEDVATLGKHGLAFVPIRRMQHPHDIMPVILTLGNRTVEPSCTVMVRFCEGLAAGM